MYPGRNANLMEKFRTFGEQSIINSPDGFMKSVAESASSGKSFGGIIPHSQNEK